MFRRITAAIFVWAFAAAAAGAQDSAKVDPKAQTTNFGPFRMGMTFDQTFARLSLGPDVFWSHLLPAPEFTSEEVEYFWIRLQDFPGLPDADILAPCGGKQSHVRFYFVHVELVRMSIRLSERDCPDVWERLTQYGKRHSLTFVNDPRSNLLYEAFSARTHEVVGYHIASGWHIIEFIKKGSPRYAKEPWCNYVSAPCKMPPDTTAK